MSKVTLRPGTPESRRQTIPAAARQLLLPASWVYRSIVAGRNFLYDLNLLSSTVVPVPVICVGNLTTGGTGKTPMVAWLAAHFRRQGKRVAILSRGYKRQNRAAPLLIRPGDPRPSIRELGDEAAMLLAALPDVALALDPRRRRGAVDLCRRWSPEVIIMDDGFQHRRLRRRLNIVMIDSQRLCGNGRLLPAGPLREPLGALQRADVVVCNKFDRRHRDFGRLAAAILEYLPAARIFTAVYQLRGCRPLWPPAAAVDLRQLRGRDVVAFAGLANPDYFFDQLAAAGLKPTATLAFPDHHDYRPADLERLAGAAAPGTMVLTTAKDAVKVAAVPGAQQLLPDLWQVEINLQLRDPQRFHKLLESRLSL
ncbi:MAG: tetraacyldisaccharide 4'-kinase, partial [Deltaproteobacteria bacterium]|nr:tetraacyldisaccharide 4'-kinase [Deltaproteobacteria bacterium]